MNVLYIRLFQLKCDCETLKSFAALVDFEHVIPIQHRLTLGDVLFRKEFYDTGTCVDDEGNENGLKAFVREWIQVVKQGEMGNNALGEHNFHCLRQ